MRIVVIEDEPRTRHGLINIIEKYSEHEVVGSESDGMAGFELVKNIQPDLVISDIQMPNKTGLEMIEDIRKEELNTEVVLLTGFSEFEYAKEAIRLSVEEYLLKPLDVEDILKALKAVEEKIAAKQERSMSPEQLLFLLLQEGVSEENRGKYSRLLKRRMCDGDGCGYLLYLMQPFSQVTGGIGEVKRNVRMIVEELGVSDYLLVQVPFADRLLLMVPYELSKVFFKRKFEDRIVKKVMDQIDGFVLAKAVESVEMVKKTVGLMEDKLRFVFDLSNEQVLDMEEVKEPEYEELVYPYNLEAKVKQSIRNGEENKVSDYMALFEEEIICSRTNPDKRKEYTVRFMFNVLECLRDLRKEIQFEQSYKLILSSLMDIQTRELLSYHFYKFTSELFKHKEEKVTENGLILMAVDYIRINYFKDISLVTTAEKVGVTPEYLSKLFKQEMGTNFRNFLTQFRMSQSKRLIVETDKKMYMIAEEVGYNDTKYFNKVFKSLNGVSPTEFRRQRG